MAANDFILSYEPNLTGFLAVKNTDGSNNLNAGDVAKLDTTNVVSGTQGAPGVVRGGASTDSPTFVVVDNIPIGKYGRVAVGGPVVRVVASAAVAAGAVLMGAAAGQVATQTAAKPQLGYALTAAAGAGDQILMLVAPAFNA